MFIDLNLTKFDPINREFDPINREFDPINREFDLINREFDLINRKFDLINRKFDPISREFDPINREFDLIRREFHKQFEDISKYPQNIKTAVWYDDFPDRAGSIWKFIPHKEIWDKMSPKGEIRNLKGQKATIAYKENQNDAFNYVVMSYDARGRVEAIMKWNENTGFDMVHYTYNSMNQVLTVTAADALYKFMIWNEYDDNGRLSKVYTKKGELNTGLFTGGVIHKDNLVFPYPFYEGGFGGGFPTTGPDIEYEYNQRGTVSKVKYNGISDGIEKQIIYNPRGWVDQLIVSELKTSPIELFSQSFERNAIGNITKQTTNRNGYASYEQDYTYDALNRLKTWEEGKFNTDELYAYDKIGNRTKHTINSIERDYTYTNNTNQLEKFEYTSDAVPYNTEYTYNNIGQMLTRLKHINTNLVSEESYKYNTAGRLVEYSKGNLMNLCSELTGLTQDESYSYDKWTYGYKYNHAGVREQKRLLTSPHGDGSYGAGMEYKVFAHLWEYYMTGAFGEEIVQYKGFQTAGTIENDAGRRVYLGAYRYRAGGEMQIRPDGKKELNITDNNGSVRLVVIQNSTGFDTLHYDYKPFGDTLWTSAGTMNRDNFDGSMYDSESDLQMMGFRMYDNETGRFTTPDLLWSAFPAQTPYHYAYNSPMTYRDPSGLAPEKEKEGEELQDGSWDPAHVANCWRPAIVVEIDHSIMRDWSLTQLIYGNRLADAQAEMQSWWNDIYNWKGPAGTEHVYHNINIKYSDGKNVNFRVYLNGRTVSNEVNMSSYIQKLMDAMRTILKADFDFFLPLVDGDYEIIIQSGTKIYEKNTRKKSKSEDKDIIYGLHTAYNINKATIRVAAEVFKDGGDSRYYYKDADNIPNNLLVWEVLGHEILHQVHYIKIGLAYYRVMTEYGREYPVREEINDIRVIFGRPIELFDLRNYKK